MTRIQKKAEKVTGELKMSGFGFDPIMVVGIITALIQLFKACNLTPAQAKRRAAEPRLLDRIVLRREISKRKASMSAANVEAIHAAILDTAKAMTAEEFKAMYEEVS